MTKPGAVGCDGCERRSRRAFIGQVSTAAFVVTVADDWTSLLGTHPVAEASAVASSGATVTYAVPSKDGVSIDSKEQVILVRYQGKVFAFPLSCPHENTALRWKSGEARFQCPKHDSRYRPDGAFMSGRATRNMDRFAVSRNGDKVVVDLEKWFQSDTQAAEWGQAFLTL